MVCVSGTSTGPYLLSIDLEFLLRFCSLLLLDSSGKRVGQSWREVFRGKQSTGRLSGKRAESGAATALHYPRELVRFAAKAPPAPSSAPGASPRRRASSAPTRPRVNLVRRIPLEFAGNVTQIPAFLQPDQILQCALPSPREEIERSKRGARRPWRGVLFTGGWGAAPLLGQRALPLCAIYPMGQWRHLNTLNLNPDRPRRPCPSFFVRALNHPFANPPPNACF